MTFTTVVPAAASSRSKALIAVYRERISFESAQPWTRWISTSS